MSERRCVSLSVFRVVVLLYPPRFRARFATAMLGAFEDYRAEAAASGFISLSSFYARTFLDTLRSGARERLNPTFTDPRLPKDEQPGRPGKGAILDGLIQDTRFAFRSLLKRPAFALVSVVAIAWLSMCVQAIRAAMSDPVKALRYD